MHFGQLMLNLVIDKIEQLKLKLAQVFGQKLLVENK